MVLQECKDNSTMLDISTVIVADGMRLLVSLYYGTKDTHVAQGLNAVVARLSNNVVLNNKMTPNNLALAFPEIVSKPLEEWWYRLPVNHSIAINLKHGTEIYWKYLIS